MIVLGRPARCSAGARGARSASAGHFARGSTDPDHIVLRAWFRASAALGRAGFRRSQWETPAAHAAEVRDAVWTGAPGARRADSAAALGAATYGYTELAELAELACYCPGRCTSRDARHAEQEAWRIERALRSSGLFRRFPGPPVAGPLGAVGSVGSPMSASSLRLSGLRGSTATLTVVGSEPARKAGGADGARQARKARSEPRDELLHPVVVRSERVFQKDRTLSLIVQLQVHPVHGEVAPALFRPLYELAA